MEYPIVFLKKLTRFQRIALATGSIALFMLLAINHDLVGNLAHLLQYLPPIIVINWPRSGKGVVSTPQVEENP